jgi:hypothetical protein
MKITLNAIGMVVEVFGGNRAVARAQPTQSAVGRRGRLSRKFSGYTPAPAMLRALYGRMRSPAHKRWLRTTASDELYLTQFPSRSLIVGMTPEATDGPVIGSHVGRDHDVLSLRALRPAFWW